MPATPDSRLQSKDVGDECPGRLAPAADPLLARGEGLLTGVAGGPVALSDHDQSSAPMTHGVSEPAAEREQVVDANFRATAAPEAPSGVHC